VAKKAAETAQATAKFLRTEPGKYAWTAGKQVVKKWDALNNLRIYKTADRIIVAGAKKGLGISGGLRGAWKEPGLAKAIFTSRGKYSFLGAAGNAAKGSVGWSVAEGLLDVVAGTNKTPATSWVTAKVVTGALKAVPTHAAFAIGAGVIGPAVAGVACTALGIAAAPAWVPVAVGVAAAIGTAIVLDKIDSHFKITENLAKAISPVVDTAAQKAVELGSQAAQAAGHAAVQAAQMAGQEAKKVMNGVSSWAKGLKFW
jgi:hypothetical protein